MNELIPRPTVEEIVANRNRALELYAEAWTAIAEADRKVKEAREMADRAHPGLSRMNGYSYSQAEEVQCFYSAVKLPDPDLYRTVARKLLDCDVWAWLIERTDLERLMDKEAKEKLRDQMRYVPEKPRRNREVINSAEIAKGLPEVSVENVMATLESFRGDADMIFRRGLANAFSKLDRRFRSHDGFKIGSRVILSYAFDHWGSWSYSSHHRDTITDIERVFAILDGRFNSDFTSTINRIDQERRGIGHGRRQSKLETEYFKIEIWKNGNAHLWFKRKDLLQKVNRILAEWYGEVIGDGQTAEDDPLSRIKHTPAKFHGFYPTPDDAADRLLADLPTFRRPEDPPPRILEPSAGTGNLARRLAREIKIDYRDEKPYRYRPLVDCVEIQPHHVEALRSEGIYNRVTCADFLQVKPEVVYDYVIMNPPFDLERDIDHVVHALKFLKPDGELRAIMSAGTEFRGTKKTERFRALIAKMNGQFRDLPPGSFSEVGTNVNTCILRVRADGRSPRY